MSAPLLTPAQLREYVETDVSDERLAFLIADTQGEIERRYGPVENVTETIEGDGRYLVTKRRVTALVSISQDGTVLDAGDYRLIESRLIERTDRQRWDPYWAGGRANWFEVVYTPEDDSGARREVLTRLCTLSLAYTGNSQDAGPDYRSTPLDYTEERRRLLDSLGDTVWTLA